MPTNDELLNPRLTGAEYYARVNALDQKEALLSVWAALFTDNCSEYDEGDLYCRYATFVSLFQGLLQPPARSSGRSLARTRRWDSMTEKTPTCSSTTRPPRTATAIPVRPEPSPSPSTRPSPSPSPSPNRGRAEPGAAPNPARSTDGDPPCNSNGRWLISWLPRARQMSPT